MGTNVFGTKTIKLLLKQMFLEQTHVGTNVLELLTVGTNDFRDKRLLE